MVLSKYQIATMVFGLNSNEMRILFALAFNQTLAIGVWMCSARDARSDMSRMSDQPPPSSPLDRVVPRDACYELASS